MPVAKPLAACLASILLASTAAAQDIASLYQAKAVVTGTGEPNRQIGFRICLDEVLARVSGDQRLSKDPRMPALRDKAASFVAGFRYRDRLEGIPIHDEQGTHDRPHDLACLYKPEAMDPVLASLGSRPWLSPRPHLAVFLLVRRGEQHFALTADGDESPYMRESFEAAAAPLAMTVAFPTSRDLSAADLDDAALPGSSLAALDVSATAAGADQALAGSIVWSDRELGWIADWRLDFKGRDYAWQVRGVSFDEAFRVAMKGAAQILSGNGQP
jgi:hypothetical protein